MIIETQLLDTLSAKAKASPRLRQAYDLRNSEEDNSQRMLNALEPGTVMPIHRHRKTSETICMVRGKMVMRLYDDKGNITDEFVMEPCGEHPMVQVEAGQWHSLEVLEEVFPKLGVYPELVVGRRRMGSMSRYKMRI